MRIEHLTEAHRLIIGSASANSPMPIGQLADAYRLTRRCSCNDTPTIVRQKQSYLLHKKEKNILCK